MMMPNTQYAKDTRNNMVQIFRAFAIIAVVLIHTTPGAYWQVFFRPFINFAVATFLFLSGYLTKIDNDNWGAFYKKRIIRILIPYVIWTVVYTIIFLDLSHLHKKLLTANASFHMYYLAVYIQFVLLTPIIGKLAKSKYMHLGWLVAPISIIVFNYYGLLSGQELNPLCHVMVLFVIMPLFPFSPSFPFLITAVVVLLLSLCLCYIGHRILGEKVSRWLGLI